MFQSNYYNNVYDEKYIKTSFENLVKNFLYYNKERKIFIIHSEVFSRLEKILCKFLNIAKNQFIKRFENSKFRFKKYTFISRRINKKNFKF